MKKFFTLASFILAVTAAQAQEYNLFPSADGWLWFNTQSVIDSYVGIIDENAYTVDASSNGKLVQLVYADQQPDYPPTEANTTIVGAGTDGETGSAGSTTGALVLQPSKGIGNINGGGFVVCLPSCSTFSIDYSSNSKVMARIVATTNPAAPMSSVNSNYELDDSRGWKIISAKYASIFGSKPKGRNQWTGIETLSNGSDKVTIKSNTPIYVWFQSATRDTVYIHGIKVITPKQETTGIRNAVQTNNHGLIEVFTLDGKALGTINNIDVLERGVYIVRKDGKTKKVVK